MPTYVSDIEAQTINKIHALTTQFRSKFWFRHHVLAPIEVFKTMSFHSNLSLYIFQKTYRGTVVMEMWRLACFIVHVMSFVLLIFGLYANYSYHVKTLFVIAPLIYVFYLIYFQRGIEERYTMPVLALVIVNAGFITKKVIEMLKKRMKIYLNSDSKG